jgi:hypothetical protein
MIYIPGPVFALPLQSALANTTIYPPSMIRYNEPETSGNDRKFKTTS